MRRAATKTLLTVVGDLILYRPPVLMSAETVAAIPGLDAVPDPVHDAAAPRPSSNPALGSGLRGYGCRPVRSTIQLRDRSSLVAPSSRIWRPSRSDRAGAVRIGAPLRHIQSIHARCRPLIAVLWVLRNALVLPRSHGTAGARSGPWTGQARSEAKARRQPLDAARPARAPRPQAHTDAVRPPPVGRRETTANAASGRIRRRCLPTGRRGRDEACAGPLSCGRGGRRMSGLPGPRRSSIVGIVAVRTEVCWYSCGYVQRRKARTRVVLGRWGCFWR